MEKKEALEIGPDATIREAMQRLDHTAEKCLFVVDSDHRLIGSLTDGDVRRAILNGSSLDVAIAGTFNSDPLVLPAATDRAEIRELMVRNKVEVIPLKETDGSVTQYITWTTLFGDDAAPADRPPIDVPVVIMAGGLGTRLEPFTKILPKPLIPIHDKPIIEHIIDRFVDVGAHTFYLTVNYKSRIMKAYFEDRAPEYTVRFIDEPEPMGTAGGLQFMSGVTDQPFFVTNCDILVREDYRRVLEFHREGGYVVTLVGSAVHYQIPYGTCVLNGSGDLARIDEKPEYDFLVNTGMYVVDPVILDRIPDHGQYHMTHLIADLIDDGKRVGVFPISEDSWIDVGQWKEFQRATERL